MNRLRSWLLMSLSFCLAATLLSGGIALTRAQAEEETKPENGPVLKTLQDYKGREVELTVEYKDGLYYLADYTRNIYIHNGTTVQRVSDMYYRPENFPIYASQDGEFNDSMAVSIYYNVVKAYDFYTEENVGFEWKGVNNGNDDVWDNASSRLGKELPIHVFVHMNASDGSVDYRYNAAYAHDERMKHCIIFVGDGSQYNYYSNMYHQGAALDVLAHEYQHGVTEFYSKGFYYYGESGALNEAFSDMIALIVEGKEKNLTADDDEFWVVGEDAVSDFGCIRNIRAPSNGFKTYYSQKYTGPQDNNGVHYNSTIVTHVQYMACKQVPGYFTYERLANLWLKTLKSLPANANFLEFAKKYRAAAADLGFSDEAQQAIAAALKTSGFPDLYRVTFQNEDGTILGTSFVQQGESATPPFNPQKEHEGNISYEFEGWDGDYSNIQKDTVITARYRQVNVYLVRFLDGNGELLEEQAVDIGGKAKVPSKKPEKESIEGKRFVFDKWDFDFESSIQKDIEVKPLFKEINVYKVKFLDGDGSLLLEAEVDEGGKVTAPTKTPQKAADENCRYEFSGNWDIAFDDVHSDLEVHPIFDEIHLYTIQFLDSNGEPLTEQYTVEEGGSVKAPEGPSKESDEKFSYTFKGWDGEYENVQESAVISPIYEEKPRTYSVAYFLEDKLFNSAYGSYGSKLDETPKGYDGWYTDRECTKPFEGNTVTGHLTLYAKKAGAGAGLIIGLSVGAAVLIAGAVLTVVLIKRKRG